MRRFVYACWQISCDQHYCFKTEFPLEGASILEMLMWWKPDQMKSTKKKENQNRDQNETICCFLYHVAYSVDQIPDFIRGFSLFFSGRQSKWDFCYWLLAVLDFHHSFAWPEVTLAVRCYMVQIGKHGLRIEVRTGGVYLQVQPSK